jgi:hypothetical protein
MGGPKGLVRPDPSPEIVEDAQIDDSADVDGMARADEIGRVAPGEIGEISELGEIGAPDEIHALAAELAAGRLTAREVIDRLVDAAAGPGLDDIARAELRAMLGDLVAADPHLGALARALAGAPSSQL